MDVFKAFVRVEERGLALLSGGCRGFWYGCRGLALRRGALTVCENGTVVG